MEIRFLGDVELRVDGRTADLGHARQRCVLVALLVDAEHPVQTDQLLSRVWGDRPPQRAREALYSYLSRLRGILGEAHHTTIVRQHGGYRVPVDPMAVDVHLFGRLVARAGAAEDAETAADLFQRALSLWRGDEAFSALDTPWVNSVRNRLHAQRLTAILDCNDLALARGDHAGVVASLSAWPREHSLDERLASQLMLALYRSGRQADALDIYQRIRLTLAEELGVDPSPPLRLLHRQILTADRALTAPIKRPATTPRQLPAAPAMFAGRKRELVALDEAMAARPDPGLAMTVAAVVGTGGIGKTWLAIQWAHRNVDRFPDGQLYVDLRGFDPAGEPLAPAAALRAFLDALGVPATSVPPGIEAQVGLYRSLVANRRMLIVLDNARDTSQVTPLLPGAAGCAVLVTSRSRLAGLITAHGARPLELEVLSEAESCHLLTGYLGADRVAAERRPVDALLKVCGGLPLALGIVAARANQDRFALSELADELRHSSTRLDGLDAGELAASLRAVFAGSYGALSLAAARLFRLLGVAPGPDISLRAAASLAGLPPSQVRSVLRQLTCASLLSEHRRDRYQMHDLARLYAAELATEHEPDESRAAALRRLLDHYLNSARAAALKLSPQRVCPEPPPCQPGVAAEQPDDVVAASAWFSAERAVLVAAVHHAANAAFHVHVWQLSFTLTTFFDRNSHWHDRETTQRAALESAERLGDRWAQAHAHRGLAIAYTWFARYDEARAHLDRTLELFEELGDRAGQAISYRTLARVWAQQGRPDQALRHDHKALAVYREIGHPNGQAVALNAIGWHHAHLGDYQQALYYCQEALAGHQESGDVHAQAATLDSLGYAHHHLGHYTQAVSCFEQALRLYQQTGDRYQDATTRGHLGDTHHSAGNVELAGQAWQRALTTLEDLADSGAAKIRAKLERLANPLGG